MTEQAPTLRFESRWPVVLTILAVIGVLALLPGRLRLVPDWVPYVMGIAVLAPMVAISLTGGQALWLRVERAVTLFFFVYAVAGTLANLANLIQAMVYRSAELDGLQLLTSSIAVWITNVLAFSLMYWQLDHGGPEARVKRTGPKPDWRFPQDGSPEDVSLGWRPNFADYLFLGYSTATAFSTTDVTPLTSRAKMLMMLESTISLLTMVVVASRAINILGN